VKLMRSRLRTFATSLNGMRIGERVRRGLSTHKARATGSYPKYLFSGMLKCGVCGSNLVICGARQGYFARAALMAVRMPAAMIYACHVFAWSAHFSSGCEKY
jgi:hypothetical protein